MQTKGLYSTSSADLSRGRYIDAGSPFTSAYVLNELAEDKNFRVRARVAENPNVPLWTLLRLVGDDHEEVRLSAFFNPKLPVIFHQQLATDPHDDVRFALAEDPCTPKTILNILIADENVYVRDRAQRTLDAAHCDCVKLAA